jgi:predicted transcriptional regulator
MKLHKWSDIRRKKLSEAELAEIDQRVAAEVLDMNLTALRESLGVTQVQMAAAAEMTQSEVSKLEKRNDHLVSTLRRAVRALGGDLEVTAVVGDKRIKLSV